MAYAQAKAVDADVIPVVDITPLRDGSDPMSVAKALHGASTGLGFIYIKFYAWAIHHFRNNTAGMRGGQVPHAAVFTKTKGRYGSGIKAQYIRALAVPISTDYQAPYTLAGGKHC